MTKEDGIENFKLFFNLYGTVNKLSLNQSFECHKIVFFMTSHHFFVMFPSLQTLLPIKLQLGLSIVFFDNIRLSLPNESNAF
jgi:hypothetical protein